MKIYSYSDTENTVYPKFNTKNNQWEYYDNNGKLINSFIQYNSYYEVLYNGVYIGTVDTPSEKEYLNKLKSKIFE